MNLSAPADADVVIIGASAAGLATAIFAAESADAKRRIIVLDGAASIGKKILISGGGRCNVTHEVVRPEDFNGSRNVVRNILAAFNEHATVRWFDSLGVKLKREETGKLFPESDRARTILDSLTARCRHQGTEICPAHRVHDISAGPTGFTVEHEHGRILARHVVMATGGRSLPRTGSDGEGWEIVQRLGHSVTATFPALVPLLLDPSFFHSALSGVSHPAEMITIARGKTVDRRTGSLLWTHFGISGPVVLDASRHWIIARQSAEDVELRCNFFPGSSADEIDRQLVDEATAAPRRTMLRVLEAYLTERLARALLERAGIDTATPAGQLPRERRRVLARSLTALPLPVIGDRSWDHAEVTAGGVPLAEIDFRTMASRRTNGLFLVGEMLDVDGRIGGFNFQWAWSTGFSAGRALARME